MVIKHLTYCLFIIVVFIVFATYKHTFITEVTGSCYLYLDSYDQYSCSSCLHNSQVLNGSVHNAVHRYHPPTPDNSIIVIPRIIVKHRNLNSRERYVQHDQRERKRHVTHERQALLLFSRSFRCLGARQLIAGRIAGLAVEAGPRRRDRLTTGAVTPRPRLTSR